MSVEDEMRPAPEEAFRDAMARWASGVSVVAARDPDDGRVHATTVSSLGSVSADPPRVVISLGPGAQVLPFLDGGSRFAVSILSREQRSLASRFTDPFPVGPDPFPEEGDPLIAGSHATLVCTVEALLPVDASRLVVGLVVEAGPGGSAHPLVYHLREYRRLD